jgi:hypothetical protein
MPPPARCLLAATVALAALLAGCDRPSATPGGRAAAPSRSAPAEPTTSRSAADELLAAYDRSWQVYADALRRLDPSRLPSAFAGNALRVAREEVAEHKAKRHPSLVRVEHHPKVLRVTGTDAVVEDNYTNHSVLLDPATGRPVEPDPNEVVYQHQSLKRINGVWKVVEVIEEKRP